MNTITVREARKTLHHLIDDIAESNAPVIITSNRHNAVLLSSKDWEAVQEALHLLALPGMQGSIIERLKTDEVYCS
ncbi:MAG: type II toxin-antitoxin system Phd/YefM family antitoxin [Glaciecola sp.]|nr:type II toxin-antitoxin system Phd/YefM family antitoxin [Glaciecola sp.]MDG1816815.1 type II toxin-antitoxin system Phd/YefM family antitoxin [Glaciecola sp.]MDG2098573.1 type II toxin-antitoxin system Phd/YefM family antitoxin [Glaciecola sp.]